MRSSSVLDRTPPTNEPAQARIVLTRNRATIIVIAAYTGSWIIAKIFLSYLGRLQGDLDRAEQLSGWIGILLLIMCAKALFDIYRRPHLQDG